MDEEGDHPQVAKALTAREKEDDDDYEEVVPMMGEDGHQMRQAAKKNSEKN